jgi:uncharacterized repeat protein (TIGR02543 family)
VKIRILSAIAMMLLIGVLFAACGGGGSGSTGTNITPTYTVTYNGNTDTGGSVPIDSTNYHQGQTVTVLDNTGILVRAGYTFSGWNTLANGAGTTYTQGQTFTMGTANVTLYALWTANPTYTVTYNGNGNTGGIVPADSTSYQQGQTVTVLGNTGGLVRTGYTFSGWNTLANGAGTTYTQAQTFTMDTANVTLYALWTANPTYTVTYNGNGNTGGIVPADSTNYQQGQTVTVLGNTGGLVRTGYTFSDWNTLANGAGTTYTQAQTFTMGTANVTLYAKWTNYCASGPAAQTFNSNMQGCAGSVTFANRATLCAAGTRVCSADQWVSNWGSTTATHNYWTDDVLNFSNGTGPCGTSACASNSCFASAGSIYTGSCGPTQSMLITTASGTDLEGNNATWVGCGFNSITPNQNFGGCSTTAGTVCCSGPQNVFVDAVSGSDTNPGTSASPFKTITHALTFASVSGDQVNVKPGTYDTTNGETFPLQVPAGVILIGDEPNRGNGTIPTKISGGAVTLGAGSTIAGFFATWSIGNGIVPTAGNSIIRNNTLRYSSGNDIYIPQGSGHIVSLNSGTGSTGAAGLRVDNTASAKVENNTFTGNTFGVYVWGNADLGGGSYGSVGNNNMSCNTNTDVYYSASSGSLFADNNIWDHTPPNVSTTMPLGGIDIYKSSGGTTVSFINSSLTSSVCY